MSETEVIKFCYIAMLSSNKHNTGSLLISEPFMIDPNFKRSVVLMVENSEEGAIGFVLNQRSDLLLNDLIQDCWNATFPVFLGGPVGKDTLHFIHRCYDRLNSGTEISDGLYWGGDFETLKMLINEKQLKSDEVKFFVGYSGWKEDQLNSEMEQNSWIIENKYSQDLLFVEDEENLWKEVVISLGPKYAHIANFPENPLWN